MIQRLKNLGFDLVVIGVLVGIGLFTVGYRESQRTAGDRLAQKRATVQALQDQREQLRTAPELPYLRETWMEVNDVLRECGLETSVIEGDNQQTLYRGAAPFWVGVVGGRARPVFSCLMAASNDRPVVFENALIQMDGGNINASMQFSIYGRINPTRFVGKELEDES